VVLLAFASCPLTSPATQAAVVLSVFASCPLTSPATQAESFEMFGDSCRFRTDSGYDSCLQDLKVRCRMHMHGVCEVVCVRWCVRACIRCRVELEGEVLRATRMR